MQRKLLFFIVLLLSNTNFAQIHLLRDTTIHGPVKSITQYRYDNTILDSVTGIFQANYNENYQISNTRKLNKDDSRVLMKRFYNEEDSLIKEIHFSSKNDTSSIELLTYGPYGLVRTITHSSFGKPKGKNYSYDEKGNLKSIKSFQLYGEGENEQEVEKDYMTFKYDDEGNLIEKEWANRFTYLYGDGKYTRINARKDEKLIYTLNKAENPIKLENYKLKGGRHGGYGYGGGDSNSEDQEENQTEESFELQSTYLCEYNDNGHLISYKRKNPNERFPKTGVYYEYEYDDQGNVIAFKEYKYQYGEKRVKENWKREITYY